MKSKARPSVCFASIVVTALLAPNLLAADRLQIDRAFIGTTDAWHDITAFLRDQVQGGRASVTLAQPFNAIGGDPALGKQKDLIVDYRLNDKPFRFWQKEQYPVAFSVTLPSPEAQPPGANAKVTALMQNVSTSTGISAWLTLDKTQDPSAWTVLYGPQKVFVYSFAPKKFKPYVKELGPLGGEDLLRDAPFDHLHHHALMYGIEVNGVNFWEEVSGSGVEKVIQSSEPVCADIGTDGQAEVRFGQILHWVAPQDAFLPDNAPVALLAERRELVLTVTPARHEVALEWKSHFEVGNKTNTVTLTGHTYHGLGMRFRQDLDTLAVHRLAGTPEAPASPVLDLSKSRQDLSRAAWAAVSFDVPGHPATLALAGHPSNARGDAVFFSMLTAFPYLSATQGLSKEPLVYHAGDTFDLNYLVLVYPESKPSETLARRVEAWRQTKP